jgi:hypothetical protein
VVTTFELMSPVPPMTTIFMGLPFITSHNERPTETPLSSGRTFLHLNVDPDADVGGDLETAHVVQSDSKILPVDLRRRRE